MGRDSTRRLIDDPGIGGDELATDDGLVGPRRLDLVASFIPLAQKVAGESLSTLVEGVEVLRQVVGVFVPARIKKWFKSYQNCRISCGEEKYVTHGGGEETEADRRDPCRHACCPPLF